MNHLTTAPECLGRPVRVLHSGTVNYLRPELASTSRHGLYWYGWWRLCLALVLLAEFGARSVWSQPLTDFWLDSIAKQENGSVKVRGGQPTWFPSVVLLQTSTNLVEWEEAARLHGMPFQFEDRAAQGKPHLFYRFGIWQLGEGDDWKNQIVFNDDNFLRFGGQFSYVKFVIRADAPTRVYYADSERYLFHRDFVSARMDPYWGIGLGELERITRFNEGRQLYLGAVLMGLSPYEYGIQFDAGDPLPPETVCALIDLVASTVVDKRGSNSAPIQIYYIPSFDQALAAQMDAAFFAASGVPVASIEDWLPGNVLYSSGWHFGRLRYVAATNISSAYASGLLLPTDILLTDGVPAEIPYVSGIITLQPTTPNSHVVLLAQSFAVPFVYLHDPAERQRVLALDGMEVALRARPDYNGYGDVLCIFGLSTNLDASLKEEILSLKSNAPVQIKAKAHFGGYFASTDVLWPSNICHFGGKAANYGLLRRTIPTNAPEAMALSMDLWDDFMDQILPGGKVLRTEISNRLSGFTTFTNVVALTNTLAGIRDLIRRTASFTAAQQQAITNALGGFGFQPTRKIRFRSSTNVEDSEAFSGAGLYDSYSGCLDDDLDADTTGPCRCDETETNERGVFRAIQRVYASFYNDNAYLMRRLHNIDENLVGMGVLVHYSTPDDLELANGVATLTGQWLPGGEEHYSCTMVSQHGAIPVANPQGDAQPETVAGSYNRYTTGENFYLPSPSAYSSLVPLGTCVMGYPTNYAALLMMFVDVARAYHDVFPEKELFTLDFEYKKVVPDWLEIKQVREVPDPDNQRTNQIVAYLLDTPYELRSDQGVEMDTMTAHRLKSRWIFRGKNMRLTPENVAGGIFSEVTWQRAHNGRVETFQGLLDQFPDYSLTGGQGHVYTSWTTDTPDGPARFTLTTYLGYDGFLTTESDPWRILGDYSYMNLDVEYTNRLPCYAYDLQLTNALLTEFIFLLPPPPREDSDARLDYEFVITNGTRTVAIQTGFFATNPDIYTDYPRIKGEMETRIEGLTTAPIELSGFFSQTWSSVHYRYADRFVFEPRLEEGISQEILDELEAADIRFLLVTHLNNVARLQIMGLDGTIREWGP